MPIFIEPGVYITVKQLNSGPAPRPLESGFSEKTAYRVLGIETFSETSEAFFILANDRDETWFISNRHFRVLGKFEGITALRMKVEEYANSNHTPHSSFSLPGAASVAGIKMADVI